MGDTPYLNLTSKVVLANDYNHIASEIAAFCENNENVCYVFTKRSVFVNFIVAQFPQIRAVDYDDVFKQLTDNSNLIISHLNITKIPDSKLGRIKRLRTNKLVIDNHPFISKSEVWYCYFLYMAFDKNLLGYPHSYAFRDARPTETHNPFDVRVLARKVSGSTTCYLDSIFDVGKIKYEQVYLTRQEHTEYQSLKDELFESETTANAIISKLKRYVDNTATMKAIKSKRLNLLYLNRVFDLYRQGIYRCIYSDAKVDLYLLNQFNTYIHNANAFVKDLNGN